MNRRTRAGRLSSSPWPWLAAAALLGLAGCAKQQLRAQAEDEGEKDRYAVETVRTVCQFDQTEPVAVSGVGLVVGLSGTGGGAPAGDYRTVLEKEFPQLNPKDGSIKELLADPDTSLVLVSALFPAGAAKGEPVDIQITLPPGSKTTSLRGGYLKRCQLRDYDIAGRLAPTLAANNPNAVRGHPVVEAQGPVVVGLGDEAARLKTGQVWGGGRLRLDRPFRLVLNDNKKYASVAKLVADRVNETFQSPFTHGINQGTAIAHNNEFITLKVPPQYRLNLPRYLRVVGLVPLRDAGEGPRGEAATRYRRRLEEEILDPGQAVTAALRLEALGEGSRATLKGGLASEHVLVRFCCAEALAYLGDPSCGKELGRVVAEQPALRAYALTALASLDVSSSQEALVDLLGSPNPETRYGAFRALRALNDREPEVRGERLGEAFWLHRVAPGTPGLVHISGRRRAEIVLFGEEPFLQPPFGLQSGVFNVTAADGDGRVTVGRFTPGEPAVRRQCSLKVEDVLRCLADLGAGYSEVVEVLRQAKNSECVTCAVEADALPQATSVYALKKAGERAKARADGEAGDDDEADDLLNARHDLGSTPTLFDKGDGTPRLRARRDAE